MNFKPTYFLYCLLFLLFSFSSNEKRTLEKGSMRCLTTKTTFEVGESIVLEFSLEAGNPPYLYCFNAYGSTLIKPKISTKRLKYTLPEAITKKSGMVNWAVSGKSENISGSIKIVPKQEAIHIDVFIGPPSIGVGKTNFSMYVAVPVDRYDNPVASNTEVIVKEQYRETELQTVVLTNNLLAYKLIYSEEKVGRILLGSECFGLNSKEGTVNVMPHFPSDFQIFEARHHDYSDGNQIALFTTSVIKDEYGNIVSDGTYVEFLVTTSEGAILKTSGATINGVASAKLIHPDYETNWTVKAIVDRMAISNELSMSFKSILKDFDIAFSKNNRTITVGPIKSFMNQLIPDGFQVKLSVSKNNKIIEINTQTSLDGFVSFQLKPDILKNDTYHIKIEMAQIKKEFNDKKLW